ncbi:probable inactive serine/threonine-protein kinase bub1 isoform X2 [Clytia hemisphaerica]|uniref:probable inactive serine/threonine-protein kinase bub1 isoform X2 n=1 Tax=Clytia hemisphaerica TaxID=252671 RepID=UPI0034D4F3FB
MEVDGVDNAWELSKENVQPLKSGRRMGDLTRALQVDSNYLHHEAQSYELELRKTGENQQEKLNVWYRYISWREQNYTGINKDTVTLLQNCLVHYKDMKEFHQNETYIELWLKMTDILDDPIDTFKFMMDNDIGTSLAGFYKSYAEHLELIGSTKQANEIYNLGIHRNVEPLDWLKEFKSEFEYRMMKRASGESVEEEMEKVRSRKVLGVLKPMKSGKVGNDRMKNQSSRTKLGSLTSSSRQPSGNRQSGGFQIYGDESNPGMLSSATGQLKSNPLDPTNNRENVKQMQRVKGTKVKGGSVSSGACAFEIFKEEEQSTEIHAATPKEIVVSSRKPLSSKKREEVQDPFYSKTIDDPKVIHKYCRDVINMGTREMSFEEIKAQLPRYDMFKKKDTVAEQRPKIVRSALDFGHQAATRSLTPEPTEQILPGTPQEPAINRTPSSAKNNTIGDILQNLEDEFNSPIESTGYFGSLKTKQPDITGITEIFSNNLQDQEDLTCKMQELDRTEQFGRFPTTAKTIREQGEIDNQLQELDATTQFGRPIPLHRKQTDITRQLQELDKTKQFKRTPPLEDPHDTKNAKSASQETFNDTTPFGRTQSTTQSRAGVTHLLQAIDDTVLSTNKPSTFSSQPRSNVTCQLNALDDTTHFGKGVTGGQPYRTPMNATNILNDLDKTRDTSSTFTNINKQGAFQSFNENDTSRISMLRQQNASKNDSCDSINNMMFKMKVEGGNTSSLVGNETLGATSSLVGNETLGATSSPTLENVKQMFQETLDVDRFEYSMKNNLQLMQKQAGFSIFDDDQGEEKGTSQGFPIFQDEPSQKLSSKPSSGFPIFQDEPTEKPSQAFPIFQDEPTDKPSQGFSIFEDEPSQKISTKPAQGFSVFQDEPSQKLSQKSSHGFGIFNDDQNNQNESMNDDMFNNPAQSLKDFNQKEGFEIFKDETNVISKNSGFPIFEDKADEKPPSAFQIFQDEEIISKSQQNSGFTIYNASKPAQKERVDMFSETKIGSQTKADATDFGLDMSHKQAPISSHLSRPVSTPSARTFIGHVTFGANISAFNETTTRQQESVNLSTIQECSGESERSRKDSDKVADQSENRSLACDPFNQQTRNNFVESISHEITTNNSFLHINGPLSHLNGRTDICLGPRHIQINKHLKRGVSGMSIYKARYTENNKSLVLKVVDQSVAHSNAHLWDFYITSTIHKRLGMANAALVEHQNFVRINHVNMYSNAACYESDFYNTGTLMDLIKLYKRHSQQIDEPLALLYVYEILKTIQTLHQLKIVHCDLRPTKFLLGDRENLKDGALSTHCLTMTSFKNSVDLALLPSDSHLYGRSHKDSYECPSMKNGEYWGPEVDYYAAAGIIHELIFQNPLNTYYDNQKQITKMCNIPPRDWDEQLWMQIFLILINGAEQINLLINHLQQILSEPSFLEQLDAAILRKEDLLMEDD